ncbi:MAG: hypothetical protein ACI35Q_09765 [Marinilabiliaceae bacterium]
MAQLLFTAFAMEVYARYFSQEGLDFRPDTVLKFGSSWDVVGAAVLINPGSAAPVSYVDGETTKCLAAITGRDDNWRAFKPDSTMRQLAKIFSGWYIGLNRELKGCILLFNLFNIRNQNLNAAIGQLYSIENNIVQSPFTSDSDMLNLTKVEHVYLGWGSAGKYKLRKYAEPIFELVKRKCDYLDPDFMRNPFYHPGFVNRAYKRNANVRKIICGFLGMPADGAQVVWSKNSQSF